MLSAFANSFRIPELRKRILFTLCMIVVMRIGASIPCPGINVTVLQDYFQNVVSNQGAGSLMGLINIFSGGAMENCAIASLGIMPYISASIMLQLLTVVLPQLGKLAREEGGRQKITQYTRYLTIVLCCIQGYMLALGFQNPANNPLLPGIGAVLERMNTQLVPEPGAGFIFMVVLCNMAGTMLLMWIGEQITDRGIGNGVSLVITVGIAARIPAAMAQAWQKFVVGVGEQGARNPLLLVLLLGLMFAVIAGVVAVTQAVRRVSVQYAKRMVGRRVYGGQTSYLPLRVNYSGVMPIIFAQTLLMIPRFVMQVIPNPGPFVGGIIASLNSGFLYYVFYGAMILFFSYFWVATMFNPIQIADELKKHGGFIPGIRPGQPTAEFLDYAMTRLTLAGALFLIVLAVMPELLHQLLLVPSLTSQFFGGTSLLIMVGVMLDTMRQIETHLLQRHYEGFLRKGRIRGRSTGPALGREGAAGPSDESLAWLGVAVACLLLLGAVAAVLNR